MKKITAMLVIAAMFSGCTSKTEHGECIGFAQDAKPELQYEWSGWNIFVAVVFSETVFVPVIVAANQYKCPVGKK